jgi:quinol monooxygenase YgiN
MSSILNPPAYCIEYFYAKQGYRESLFNALLKLVEPSRAEAGCQQYDVLIDSKNPNLIILIVKFIDQKTMLNHEKKPYVQDFCNNAMTKYCEKFLWHYATEALSI